MEANNRTMRTGDGADQLKGFLFGLASALLFSLTGIIIKYVLSSVSHWEVVFYRSLVSCFVILPGILRQKPRLGHRKPLLIVRGLVGFVGISGSFYTLGQIPLVTATLLFQVAPLFVVPLSALLIREKASLLEIVFVLVGFGGVALVVRPTDAVASVPSLIGLGAAFTAAFSFILTRELGKTERSSVIVFYFNAFNTVLSIPFLIGGFHALTLSLALLLLANGLLGVLAHWFMAQAYRYEKAHRIATLNFVNVPLSAVWGLLIWREIIDAMTVIGGLLALGSVLFIQLRRSRK